MHGKIPLAKSAGGIFFLLVLALSGCASLAGSLDRQAPLNRFAENSGFTHEIIPTSSFQLTTFSKITRPGAPLHVYIEGDGFAWESRSRLSMDPTPFHAVGLELAAADPAENVLYLARPCQYTPYSQEKNYDSVYWSSKRFSEEVIASTNEALSQFVARAKSERITLTGYSGGAAVAVLVAARRSDVESLRTVAGNLDPTGLNRHHHVDNPAGSLDPMSVAAQLKNLPQHHFIGEKDRIVPPLIVKNFQSQMGETSCVAVTEVKGMDHGGDWAAEWPALLRLPAACS